MKAFVLTNQIMYSLLYLTYFLTILLIIKVNVEWTFDISALTEPYSNSITENIGYTV